MVVCLRGVVGLLDQDLSGDDFRSTSPRIRLPYSPLLSVLIMDDWAMSCGRVRLGDPDTVDGGLVTSEVENIWL